MDILYTDAIKQRKPVAFNVMMKPIGAICNLDCTYCYYLEKEKLYSGKDSCRMPVKLLEIFTKQYIEAHEVPLVTFTWQGGEPTMRGLDFFRRALSYQKKYSGGKKIDNAFQTNGTLLDDDWCRFFKDNEILVGISIDGDEHNHNHYRKNRSGGDTFDKVMRGIELLHKHRVEFNTLSCVNDYNVRYGLETYRFLKQVGSRFMQFIPIVERRATDITQTLALVEPDYNNPAELTSWSVGSPDYGRFLIEIFDEWVKKDVARYYVQMFDVALANWVGAMPGLCVYSETCGDAMVMEYNGDLYSCDHFVYPQHILGNLATDDLLKMVKSQKQLDFGINKRTRLPRYCQRCEVRFACHGECPKNRIAITPDGEPGLNHLCEGLKTFFNHVTPYMDYMAKQLKNKQPPARVMDWLKQKERETQPIVLPGRNEPCPCGSGNKFKSCCYNKPPYINIR